MKKLELKSTVSLPALKEHWYLRMQCTSTHVSELKVQHALIDEVTNDLFII